MRTRPRTFPPPRLRAATGQALGDLPPTNTFPRSSTIGTTAPRLDRRAVDRVD